MHGYISYIYAVEPLNKGHIGRGHYKFTYFVLYRVDVLFLEVSQCNETIYRGSNFLGLQAVSLVSEGPLHQRFYCSYCNANINLIPCRVSCIKCAVKILFRAALSSD